MSDIPANPDIVYHRKQHMAYYTLTVILLFPIGMLLGAVLTFPKDVIIYYVIVLGVLCMVEIYIFQLARAHLIVYEHLSAIDDFIDDYVEGEDKKEKLAKRREMQKLKKGIVSKETGERAKARNKKKKK